MNTYNRPEVATKKAISEVTYLVNSTDMAVKLVYFPHKGLTPEEAVVIAKEVLEALEGA